MYHIYKIYNWIFASLLLCWRPKCGIISAYIFPALKYIYCEMRRVTVRHQSRECILLKSFIRFLSFIWMHTAFIWFPELFLIFQNFHFHVRCKAKTFAGRNIANYKPIIHLRKYFLNSNSIFINCLINIYQ